jgi:hypothetical protein
MPSTSTTHTKHDVYGFSRGSLHKVGISILFLLASSRMVSPGIPLTILPLRIIFRLSLIVLFFDVCNVRVYL